MNLKFLEMPYHKQRILFTILFVVILLLPFLNSFDAGIPLGSESLYHIRMAEQGSYDSLMSRQVVFTGYHWFLQLFLGVPYFWIVLPLLLGGLSMWLLISILEHKRVPRLFSFCAATLLVMSPLIFQLFTVLQPYGLAVTLLLLAVYAAINIPLLVPVLLFLQGIIDPVVFLVTFGALFFVMPNKRTFISRSALVSFMALVVFFIIYQPYLPLSHFAGQFSVQLFFVELGTLGYSFALVVLALLGAIVYFGKKFILGFLSLIALLFLPVFYFPLIYFCFIVMILLAAYGLRYLLKHKWVLKNVKDFTLLLVFCALLFAFISFLVTFVAAPPTTMVAKTLTFLETVPDEGAVFTDPADGFLVTFFAERSVFIDEMSPHYSDYNQKIEQYNAILTSTDIELVDDFFAENNIRFVFVGVGQFTNGKGLDFLLQHSDRFVKIFDRKGLQLYYYEVEK